MTYIENNLLSPCNSGWTCPKCGSVYAPFVQQCRKCNGDAQNADKVTGGQLLCNAWEEFKRVNDERLQN